jgi:putative salt-induced outer membrane protein YdiY
MGQLMRVPVVAGLVVLLMFSMGGAALADGAWIDALPGSWNTPGAAIPRAPAGDADQLARCAEQARPASTAADRALEAAGWKPFGPVLSHGSTSIVRAMSNADGMCRPLGYQFFLFVGDDFAGTLSPAPMDSRADGALSDLSWLDAASATVTFSRYAEADALCCPSAQSAVVYAVEQRDGRPVLVALSAQTYPLTPPPEAEPPPPLWTGSFGAGLSLTTGNTETSSYNLAFDVLRDPKKLWVFRANGLYLRSEDDGEDTADKTLLHLREERLLTERLFAFGDVGYLRDRFKDIDYLISPSVGLGWNAILPEPVSLVFDGGVGAAFEKNPGGESTSDAAFNLGESLVWKLSPRATLTQSVRGLWKFDDTEDAFYHGEIAIAASLSKRSELKVAYLVDYDNLPTTPDLDKTDTALLAAIVMKF